MNAPKTIDYLSLDVEGSESEILRPFPFTGSGEDEVSHAERLQYLSSLSSGPASAPDFSCGKRVSAFCQRLLHEWGDALWVHECLSGFQRGMSQLGAPEPSKRM